jgi:hypothetical protein
MLPNFSMCLTALLCMTHIAYADYCRFTLDNYTCIEHREWDTDHVYFRMNMVRRGSNGLAKRNETRNRARSSLVPLGKVTIMSCGRISHLMMGIPMYCSHLQRGIRETKISRKLDSVSCFAVRRPVEMAYYYSSTLSLPFS